MSYSKKESLTLLYNLYYLCSMIKIFKYRPRNGPIVKELSNEHNYNNTKSIVFLSQKIALRLTMLSELHKEIVEKPAPRVNIKQENNDITDEKEGENLLRSPTIYMSTELFRVSIITNHIFSRYWHLDSKYLHKAMIWPDLWWKPIVEMLKK